MNWLHGLWFHAWHFTYQQVQLTNWFGNIVAGVVGFVVGSGLWARVIAPWWRRFHLDIHATAQRALHGKLDHIIFHHPDIPDYEEHE